MTKEQPCKAQAQPAAATAAATKATPQTHTQLGKTKASTTGLTQARLPGPWQRMKMKTAGGQTVIATPVPKTAEDSARPVTCPHCGNRFLNQNGLVSHIRMSTLTCNTESVAAQKRAAAAMQDLFSGHAGQTAGIGTIRNCCEQTEPVDGSFGSEHSGVTRRYIPECSPARRAVACAAWPRRSKPRCRPGCRRAVRAPFASRRAALAFAHRCTMATIAPRMITANTESMHVVQVQWG